MAVSRSKDCRTPTKGIFRGLTAFFCYLRQFPSGLFCVLSLTVKKSVFQNKNCSEWEESPAQTAKRISKNIFPERVAPMFTKGCAEFPLQKQGFFLPFPACWGVLLSVQENSCFIEQYFQPLLHTLPNPPLDS